jgi:hypothetical protein
MAPPHSTLVHLLLLPVSVDALRAHGIRMQVPQDVRTRDELRNGIANFYGKKNARIPLIRERRDHAQWPANVDGR